MLTDSHINFSDVNVHVISGVYVSNSQDDPTQISLDVFKSFAPAVAKKAFIEAEFIRFVGKSSFYQDILAISHDVFKRLRQPEYPPRLNEYLFHQIDYNDRGYYLLDRALYDKKFLTNSESPLFIIKSPLWNQIPYQKIIGTYGKVLYQRLPGSILPTPKSFIWTLSDISD